MLVRLGHIVSSLISRSSRAPAHAIAGEAALDRWISEKKGITLSETLHTDRVSDLYITLPTRDGTTRSYVGPKNSDVLGFGHHLAFFHPRTPERHLRADGTETDFCPPEPFVRRMWAGGRMEWRKPLIIGGKACARANVSSVYKKGFEGVAPMVFVNQRIEITNEGEEGSAVLEERSHVYLAALGTHRRTARDGKPRLGYLSKPYYVLYFASGVSQCTVCRHQTFRSSSRPVQLRCSGSPR
jgi:hydroxyacyl-ACP dehydratase HTD2-like protein with hotdog domain